MNEFLTTIHNIYCHINNDLDQYPTKHNSDRVTVLDISCASSRNRNFTSKIGIDTVQLSDRQLLTTPIIKWWTDLHHIKKIVLDN